MRCIRFALMMLLVILCLSTAQAAPTLDEGFYNPPPSARPWVYWFWLNGNITREGITADLEAMKRVGIGGVLIMEVDQGAPVGPVDFAGDKWREMFKHVCSEAGRLGIEVNMNNDAGWNGSGGPWITPALSMQKVTWTETKVEGPKKFDGTLPEPAKVANYYRDITVLAYPTPEDYRIPDIDGKAGFHRQDFGPPSPYANVSAGKTIVQNKIVELTASMTPDGHLTWDVPAGNWTILRLGHTSTGMNNAPAPTSGRGLECDKLSKEGSEAAFNGLMGKLIADNGPLVGKSLVRTHIDSWENGSQNWTPKFREEFKRLRGYDPLKYLPVMIGRVVDSTAVSERFLWDLRRTISDLIIENYAGNFRTLAKKNGISLSIEAYGDTTVDDLAYAGRADEPMGEFWSWDAYGAANTVIEMANSADVYGKRIVGAEAFTANDRERWQSHPGTIKAMGDWAFCAGINRFVFHRYALQPWIDIKPGMSMGPWGLHYERTQTWWEQSGPWHQYLARCQYLLQQGLSVVDVLELQPEGAPRGFNPPQPSARGGFRTDGCPADALLTRVSVKNGRLALPDGMSYRALVLPGSATMTPEVLRKVKQLADAGAIIIGSKPAASPSLMGYPQCDEEVRTTADALWKSGKIITGKTVEAVLKAKGVVPDFKADRPLNYIHKLIGNTDVYLVASSNSYALNALCEFRIKGKKPELWNAETGDISIAANYTRNGDVIKVPLRFEPSQSVFVVFRDNKNDNPVLSITRDGKQVYPVSEDKKLQFTVSRAMWGPAGDASRTKDVTDQVKRMLAQGRYTFTVAELASEGDPAFNIVKTLRVEYVIDGKSMTASATDPEIIAFQLPADEEPLVRVAQSIDGHVQAEYKEPGVYILKTKSGRTSKFSFINKPLAVEVPGPWKVEFEPNLGAPASATFDKLISWSDSDDPGIKYFSGHAAYSTSFTAPFTAPLGLLASTSRIYLDLGNVQVMAEVILNGHNLGILWKKPYRLDVTNAMQIGENKLTVKVVNLWINRMIGDELLPEDSERNGGTLTAWPKWVQDGQPNPHGRYTFSSWKLWNKNDKPVESGLIGPVTLQEVIPRGVR